MRIARILGTAGALLFSIHASLAGAQNAIGLPETKAASSADTERLKGLNAVARFCAGLDVDPESALYDLTQTADWTEFADKEKARWREFVKSAEKVRAWAGTELSRLRPARGTVFYPFGGPDILFANLIMPSAKLYVLVGLEPVGSPPEPQAIRQSPLAEFLAQYSLALDDITRLSFFRRADLKTELASPTIDGLLPIFMVLLAQMDKELVAVERGRLDRRGDFVSTEDEPVPRPRVLRIRFQDRHRGTQQTLIYFRQDLSNQAVDSNRSLNEFVNQNLAHCFGFIKSASYLMHKQTFSSIREMILKLSDVVLQDDSGIPFRLFDPELWTVDLYGSYNGPIEVFKEFFEQDLFDAYKAGAKPLGFRIGYGRKSHLLLAFKKTP
jgi:hypothetical protein